MSQINNKTLDKKWKNKYYENAIRKIQAESQKCYTHFYCNFYSANKF